jgi:anti-sigma factor RsiW
MTAGPPPFGLGHLGDLLSGLLDRELSIEEEFAARQHLDECTACALELENVRLARSWVRGLPAVEPPSGFFERILLERPLRSGHAGRLRSGHAGRLRSGHRGREPVPPSLRRRLGVAAFAASAAAAVVLVGITPPRDVPVSPPVVQLVEAHATGASFEGDPLSRLAPLGVPVSFGR